MPTSVDDWFPGNPWYEDGEYDGTSCANCGRERVMICDAPDGTERRVCEKCRWDQQSGDYALDAELWPPEMVGKEGER
jgi:hypothetical protein